MNTVHIAFDQCFAIERQKAFVVANLHSTGVIWKLKLRLTELAEVKGFLKSVHYSLYQDEFVEVLTGERFIACNRELSFPVLGADLRLVDA